MGACTRVRFPLQSIGIETSTFTICRKAAASVPVRFQYCIGSMLSQMLFSFPDCHYRAERPNNKDGATIWLPRLLLFLCLE